MISAMPQTVASVLLFVLLGAVPVAHAQSRVGVVTTLQGPATVARVSIPEPAPLKFRDDVFLYDRIATGEDAFARILLGGKALVTLRERSTLHLTEVPGTSPVELGAGNAAVAVVKEKMKPGESVEIRTPNAVAAIRGTVVIAEYDQGVSTFTVIRGIVDVMRLDPVTRRVIGAPVRLNPLQRLDIRGTAPLQPQALSQEVLRRVGGDFKIPVDEQANVSGATPAQPPSQAPPASGGTQGSGASAGGSGGGGSAGAASTSSGSAGGGNVGSAHGSAVPAMISTTTSAGPGSGASSGPGSAVPSSGSSSGGGPGSSDGSGSGKSSGSGPSSSSSPGQSGGHGSGGPSGRSGRR